MIDRSAQEFLRDLDRKLWAAADRLRANLDAAVYKHAVLGLTKAWAKELAPWNVLVNAVNPGGVMTEMPIRVQGMEKIREKEKKVPLGRWAQPAEIAEAVAFLASDEAAFITGQAISPNGGETIVGF